MSSIPALAVLFLAAIALSPVLAQEKAIDKTIDKTTGKTIENSSQKPASVVPDFSKEAYVIEKLHTLITEEGDGTGTRERKAEIRMVAEAGVKLFAVLNFTYTSANETVDVDYVRVRKPDGTVVKTPDYNIQDMPAEVSRTAPMYSDIHEKHIAVKGLGVGDVLEYLVRYRVLKPEIPGQFWYEDSFIKDAIVKDQTLELNVPADKYIKVVSPDFKPVVKDAGARRIYTWTRSNLTVKEKDPNEVPRRVPPNPSVQITTFAGWDDIGKWYGGLQKDPLEVTPAIQAKAAELTKGLKTDDEKIHALYNFVALKFHYIGLDFGIGRYQPHPADDVLGNGYGDCKDKHTMLASLLKAVGIEAWPALIHGTRKLDPDVPSPAQFNHVITVIPSGGKFIWVDTTPEVAPYQLLMPTLRNKQALVIPTDKPPQLMTTPANPPFPSEQEFSMKGKLAADGTFTGHAEQSYRGDTEVMLRAWFRNVSQSQWKDAMQRFSYGLNFGGDVSNVTASPPDDLDKPFEISYDYERKNYADWEHHQIVLPLPPMGVEVTKDSREKKPLEPVLLGALGKVTYRARMELPPGYSMVAPSPVNLVEPYAEYHTTNALENGVLTTTRLLKVKRNEVALNDWDDFRKFGRAIGDDEFDFIRLDGSGPVSVGKTEEAGKEEDAAGGVDVDEMFRQGSNALQQRDFQRAQDLFEKIISKNPNYRGAHFNLGIALAARNNLSDAMDQFREEEKVSPSDPHAYQVVASYMMQRSKPDEAIQEWRKLLKVDPGNRTAASSLGSLLYETEKYPEAVGVLETAVKAAPDSSSLQMQLGQAYLKMGQSDKAVVALRRVVEQKADDPETLNNVAYTLADNKINLDLARQYAEKSVGKLEEQAQGAESSDDVALRVTYDLSLVWDTLGWVYFQQGDANRAEGLVRSAWLLSEEAIVGEHLGEIYEKEGKTELAAHAYQNALSVSSIPSVMFGIPRVDLAKSYQTQAKEITARYEKLTGKKPGLTEIRRLPNGEWTQTPAEKLRHSREVGLSNEEKLTGSAEYIVVFKPGKVDSAEYLSGSAALDKLSAKLIAAHYPLEFPPDSGAILALRIDVNCHPTAPCIASLLPPVAAPSTQFRPPAY
jgi:tetratricopeptide (TPR) repeat protein/transglutaminase-like putative cysteine protease